MVEILLLLTASFSGAILIYLITVNIKKYVVVHSMKKELRSGKSSIINTYKYSGRQGRFGNIRIAQSVHEKLQKAGWKISEYLFLFIMVLSSIVMGFLFYKMIDNIVSIIMGVSIGAYAPFFILSMAINRRRRNFNGALSSAISMLVRMMRNGIGFEQALRKSIDANESKIFKNIFGKFLREKEIVGEEKAFMSIYGLVDSSELQIFGISVVIGRNSGGKFSNTLEKLEESINSRVKLQRKIDVATREASVGSYLIIVILAIIFGMMDASFEGNMSKYFFGTEKGKFEFMLTMIWVALGLFLNSFLTKIR